MKWPFLATLTTAGTLVALVAPAWQDLTQTTPDGLGKPPVVSAAAAPAGTETLAVHWVKVTAPDGIGLLEAISRWFAERGVSIEAAEITTRDGTATDRFLVDGEFDPSALASHLSRAPGSPWSRLRHPRCRWLARAGR